MFLSLIIGMKQSKKYNIEEEDLIDMFLVALPFAVIFARLFFVVFTWDNFKNDLLGIFRIWEGGLAIYGGLIGAVGAVLLFCKKRKMDVLNLFDFACVYLPLSQAIGRLGNFTNQELYGTYTDLPWGMTGSRIGDIPVHPAFLYEFVFNLIIFLILLKLRKNKKVKGSVFATYLMSYSLIRFLLEFIRTDEFGTGNIRYNQVVAAAVFVLSFIWLIYLIIRSKRSEGLPAESESPEGLDTEFDNLAAEKEDNQDTVEDKGLI